MAVCSSWNNIETIQIKKCNIVKGDDYFLDFICFERIDME